ncbi:MAG: hypothetical protein ACREJQ_08135 [bacterium]
MANPGGIEFTEQEWLRQLAELRPEVRLPGFWANLAENCTRWAAELSVGPFWAQAKDRLDRWRMEYRAASEADLLTQPGLPPFTSKPEQSIRDKLFRRCKENGDHIQKAIAPAGPPLPRLGDLVRTRIACRYIDGVEFLASKLLDLAEEMGLSPSRRREGRIEGYFAQHVTVSQEVIFRLAGHGELTKVVCEVQIASEMATRMWDAAHPLYETVRGKGDAPEDWQWKPDDPRFISNQLGHMIHLADGLLVQLRRSIGTRRG